MTVRPVSALLLAVLLAGCAQDAGGAAPSSDAAVATRSGVAASADVDAGASASASADIPAAVDADGPATVSTAKVDPYGGILVDRDDHTLYVFLEDTDGTSTCDRSCADNWPPLLTAGPASAEGRVRGPLLDTVERDDGTTQVTYDGRPLYHYSGDTAPGDILGYGLGDVWYPVARDGAPVDVAQGRTSDDGY